LVSISGLPGAGTTTAAAGVAAALGLDVVNGGEVFREMAAENGMGLAEFGAHAAAHPTVDIELDRRLAERARHGGVVVESRLGGWILHNETLDGLRVWLRCDDVVRAERVAGREGTGVEQALAENTEREKVEHERYLALYGIDLRDLSIYHEQIDTGVLDPDSVVDLIVDAARSAI
jgi:CMP/dCMP kinase